MLLIYIAALILFLLWWSRGSIWPALAAIFVTTFIAVMSFSDHGAHIHPDPTPYLIAAVALSVVAFIPLCLRIYRKRRIERTLLGVRFNGAD